jgi:ubiquinone/menaquinone biosynthesis C-methylase UbiE
MNGSGQKRGCLLWFVICIVLVLGGLFFLADLGKFDYTRPFSRESWQLPDLVLESLRPELGSQIADIGAGTGYFTFKLARSVGSKGKVHAVEVDEDLVAELAAQAEVRRYPNVISVLGEANDPKLPNGQIDLAFLCNTYHHIENPEEYFAQVKKDLKPEGRVAILDLKPVPLVRIFAPAGHWATQGSIEKEMNAAGFVLDKSYDFLPIQHFLIFRPGPKS